MIYECAPMEGVTGDLFRQAQRLHFAAADKYYTPFLSPTSSRTLSARELREVDPAHNAGSSPGEDQSPFHTSAPLDRSEGKAR